MILIEVSLSVDLSVRESCGVVNPIPRLPLTVKAEALNLPYSVPPCVNIC